MNDRACVSILHFSICILHFAFGILHGATAGRGFVDVREPAHVAPSAPLRVAAKQPLRPQSEH